MEDALGLALEIRQKIQLGRLVIVSAAQLEAAGVEIADVCDQFRVRAEPVQDAHAYRLTRIRR